VAPGRHERPCGCPAGARRRDSIRDHRLVVHGAHGTSFFFFGSFVGFTIGTVLPLTGDQDLILRLFTPTGPRVSSSFAFGTALDLVWFTFPFPFVPVFQVIGFATGVCSNFSANGV